MSRDSCERCPELRHLPGHGSPGTPCRAHLAAPPKCPLWWWKVGGHAQGDGWALRSARTRRAGERQRASAPDLVAESRLLQRWRSGDVVAPRAPTVRTDVFLSWRRGRGWFCQKGPESIEASICRMADVRRLLQADHVAMDSVLRPVGRLDVSEDEGVDSTQVLPTGAVTLLLTDIEGSTRMWEASEELATIAVARHHALLDAAVSLHGGVRPLEQGEGDSVVAAFARPSDALAAALDAQRAFADEQWPEGAAVRVRIGLHTGEIALRDVRNSLTPTEERIVALAAEGLTNPQIAERMFIARGTVKVHLSHVFAKLGVSTRAELAGEATRRAVERAR
jgi:DNA-binding CsgD family transcriptional regulator